MENAVPIPGPRGFPIIGNAYDLDFNKFAESLELLAETYGEIFQLQLGGEGKVFISSQELVNEVCDEKRFTKKVAGALNEIRNLTGNGLFTAYPEEHDWEVAHRTLMPAFGPINIRDMFDEMHDIASQLVVKWARFSGQERIDVIDDFTKLTLDSVALCAMAARFNSFYKEGMHPFVGAMGSVLVESGHRSARPAFANYFMSAAQKKYDSDIALCRKICADLVAERRAHPTEKKDLMNAMLNGKDPKTGENLTEESIINNMITFMIAGHDTTANTLSFLFYYLLKNPEEYRKAQAEVDRVVGRGPITVDHVTKLPFIASCIRETLRLMPPVSTISLQIQPSSPLENTMIGGKYLVKKGESIVAVISKLHRDPSVWGDDADSFRPDRVSDENFAKLPPNSWKPFGNGVRACIGRPFAWQEMNLGIAMLLQTFNFRMDDPSYTLKTVQMATIKPAGFYMQASLRDHIDLIYLEKMLHVDAFKGPSPGHTDHIVVASGKPKLPMSILYGSNSGTCEALAQSLARAAAGHGFDAKVDTLDSVIDKVPKDHPVVLISSSYEGQPPDNAAHFVAWLKNLDKKALEGVKYTVYGVGNHDWAATFHKVPKLIDTLFAENGATKFADSGFGDVGAGDIFDGFDDWQDKSLWPGLGGGEEDIDSEEGLELEIDSASRSSKLRQDVKEAIVISNELLTLPPGEAEKRHITLKLPSGASYKVGDYLAVLPLNPTKTIHRALLRFGVPWDAMITVQEGQNTTLPTGHPVSIFDIFGAYVELSQPATRRQMQKVASSIAEEKEREEVLALAASDLESVSPTKRLSVLDLLEQYPNANLPLSSFLAMLPPMRIRQYSISSSPLNSADTCSITWTVLDKANPSKTDEQKRYIGVASSFLAHVKAGDRIHVAVKPCHGNFHPPNDIENTPVIMLCAGSGLAPFRGFVQERAIQAAAGRKLAPAYLFIGCSHPDRDQIFNSELQEWEKAGVVRVFYAYSKAKELSKGCKYVQERLFAEGDEMVKVFGEGAKIYICGSSGVGEGVAHIMKKLYRDKVEEVRGKEVDEEEVEEWFAGIKADRYASDVFV